MLEEMLKRFCVRALLGAVVLWYDRHYRHHQADAVHATKNGLRKIRLLSLRQNPGLYVVLRTKPRTSNN